jgi:hypothetical protein
VYVYVVMKYPVVSKPNPPCWLKSIEKESVHLSWFAQKPILRLHNAAAAGATSLVRLDVDG